jgi:hypothetical protein
MLPTEEQLMKMPLAEIEHLLHGCSPGSDKWNIVWPVYETKRRRSENKCTVVYFSISTTIALVGSNPVILSDAAKARTCGTTQADVNEGPSEPLSVEPAA